ncbi:MAG: DNA-directed DNA polymerase [Candidatus Aenigmarchaeota archaeon]|nr:DNA-directed DNA polymerase [Candidatus Aenigmarchaeota archaeon]
MDYFLLNADYELEGNKGVILLYCKDKNGNFKIIKQPYKSYFYILTKSLEKTLKKLEEQGIKDMEVVEKILNGVRKKLIKVYSENPREIPKIRDVVKEWEEVEEEYEYSISYVYKYLLDKSLEPTSWISVEDEVKPKKSDEIPPLTIMAFDIEVIEDGKEEKIIMISIVDNKGRKKVLSLKEIDLDFVENFEEEKRMIEHFFKKVKEIDPDIICTYNGDAFDFVKLKERCEKLKIKMAMGKENELVKFEKRGRSSAASIKDRIHIDLFNFVDHILSPSLKTEVLTLDEVAKEILGEGKIKMDLTEIKESWTQKKDIEKIAHYCLKDAELTLALAEHLLPQIFSLSRLTISLPFDTSRYYYSQLVEHFLMRKSSEDNRIIPNMPKYDEIEIRRLLPSYTGAIVIEPKTGLHENIVVFDFQSLYPTIIVTHNISPETLNCGHTECRIKNTVPNGKNYFCIQQKGFIPRHLEEIIYERRRVKEELKKSKDVLLKNYQHSLKIIANALYGYFSYSGSRWFCKECGEACAAFGRYYITKVIESAKTNGFEIIYADTDSCFIKIKDNKQKDEVLKWNEKINEALPGIIELEYRDFYPVGIFVARKADEKGAKKRYALLDEKGNLEIRGFETVRRDWCELAKKVQHEVLKIILVEKNLNKAIKYVKDEIQRVKDGKVKPTELIIRTQLTSPLSAYKQIGPHVKAAMKLKEAGMQITEGMIIEYIVVKGSGSISERSEPFELYKGDYDPEYYVNHQVLPSALRVLQAFDIKEDLNVSTKSLHHWFKK